MGMFNFIGDWRNKLNAISPVNVRKFVDAPITKLTGLSDRQLHPIEGGLDEWATQHDNKYRQGGSYGRITDAATIAAMTMGAGAAAGAGAGAAGSGAGAGATAASSTAPAMYGSYGAGAYGTAAGYGGAGAATSGAGAGAGTAAGAAGTSGGLLSTAGSYVKPTMQSMQAAQTARGLLTPTPQAPMQAPQNNSAQGARILAQLAQNPNSGLTPEQIMRLQRRQNMWG